MLGFSTVDKEQNPETQLLKLRSFCVARGYFISGEYIDRASGANPFRPQLQKLMVDARQRLFDAILIVRLDRIMRSTKNLLNMIEELQLWGVQLICTDQPIETNTAIGRLIITLLGAMAEFEHELIVERVRDGMARAKAQGRHLGRSSGSKDKKKRKARSDKGGHRIGTPLLPQPSSNALSNYPERNKELLLSSGNGGK